MKTAATLLAAALGAAVLATPASAHTCTAAASQPVFSGAVATGTGSHSCTGPEYRDLTVVVCLEVLSNAGEWNTHGCQTTTRTSTRIVFGQASATVCGLGLLVRTTAYGMSSLGEHDYAESTPVLAACVR